MNMFNQPRVASGRFSAYPIRAAFFDTPSPALYWLLGVLAADGHVEAKSARFGIAQSGPYGQALVRTIADLIGFEGPIGRGRTASGQTSYSLRATSPEVVARLSDFNITPGKTKRFRMNGVPDEHLLSFLRGYIDGDGCVGLYKVGRGQSKMLSISLVGTAMFAAQLAARLPDSNPRLTEKRSVTDVRWNGRYAYALGVRLYDSRLRLPDSAKSDRYRRFVDDLRTCPPVWLQRAEASNA